MRDMLTRFKVMREDAKERCIRITDDQIAQFVVAGVIEDVGVQLKLELHEIDKSLITLSGRSNHAR